MSAVIELPGAWYDLVSRVSAAQSVASCALEAVPDGLNGMDGPRLIHVSNLIVALEDILKLMANDVNLLETQLEAAGAAAKQ